MSSHFTMDEIIIVTYKLDNDDDDANNNNFTLHLSTDSIIKIHQKFRISTRPISRE